jgi:hypothetical protein
MGHHSILYSVALCTLTLELSSSDEGDHKGAPLLCPRSGLSGSSIIEAHPYGINSNLFVQESQNRRPAHGWKGEHLLVILSEAKDLARWATRSFASLRMTLGGRFVSPCLMSRWDKRLESMPQGCAPTMPTKRLARPVHSRGDGLSSPCGGVVALRWDQDVVAIASRSLSPAESLCSKMKGTVQSTLEDR